MDSGGQPSFQVGAEVVGVLGGLRVVVSECASKVIISMVITLRVQVPKYRVYSENHHYAS